MVSKLLVIPGVRRHQVGELEAQLLFPADDPECLREVLRLIRARVRTQGDFDLVLCGLLGEGAPLSAPPIAWLKAGWQAEYDLWKTRSVAELEVVYLWVDGMYVKAGLSRWASNVYFWPLMNRRWRPETRAYSLLRT